METGTGTTRVKYMCTEQDTGKSQDPTIHMFLATGSHLIMENPGQKAIGRKTNTRIMRNIISRTTRIIRIKITTKLISIPVGQSPAPHMEGLKIYLMTNPLFIDSFALIKVWAAGFFLLDLTGAIHILLVIAVLAFLTGLIYRKSIIQNHLVNKEYEALHKKYGV
jgi:hypothetical protein